MKLILATHNPGKISEIRKIFLNSSVTICTLREISGGDSLILPEEGHTLEENAEQKCRACVEWLLSCNEEFDYVGSEDSGLFVQALQGAPGVFSARYAGIGASAEDNIQKLLNAMSHVTRRNALFRAVVCLMNPAKAAFFFHGEMKGTIAYSPRGTEGFGYDPVFIPRGYRSTLGELNQEIKNSISHRKQAWQKAMHHFLQVFS